MSNQVKLTGHNYPQPPPVCITKETKQCPNCNSSKLEGFEILFDKTLAVGIACLCWVCGFRC